MSTRFTKSIPEFVYFEDLGEGWIAGPYVHPKPGRDMRKFTLSEVVVSSPKIKKKKK